MVLDDRWPRNEAVSEGLKEKGHCPSFEGWTIFRNYNQTNWKHIPTSETRKSMNTFGNNMKNTMCLDFKDMDTLPEKLTHQCSVRRCRDAHHRPLPGQHCHCEVCTETYFHFQHKARYTRYAGSKTCKNHLKNLLYLLFKGEKGIYWDKQTRIIWKNEWSYAVLIMNHTHRCISTCICTFLLYCVFLMYENNVEYR